MLDHFIGVSLFIRSARSRHTRDMSYWPRIRVGSRSTGVSCRSALSLSLHAIAVDQFIDLRRNLLDIVASNLDVVMHSLGTFLHVFLHYD
jgi:hypothetical protein